MRKNEQRIITDQYKQYASVLERGGVLGYPTDTVWGLAADMTNKRAVDRLYVLKQRDSGKPISVLMRDIQMAERYADITKTMRCIMNRLLPGPFTIVVPSAQFPQGLGIRILDREIERNIFRHFNKPIALTSANISGEKPATAREDMLIWEKEGVVIVQRHNSTMSGTASAVISLHGNTATVLRAGEKQSEIQEAADACGVSIA